MFHGRYRHPFMSHTRDAVSFVQIAAGVVDVQIDLTTYRMHAGQLSLVGTNQVRAGRPVDHQGWLGDATTASALYLLQLCVFEGFTG